MQRKLLEMWMSLDKKSPNVFCLACLMEFNEHDPFFDNMKCHSCSKAGFNPCWFVVRVEYNGKEVQLSPDNFEDVLRSRPYLEGMDALWLCESCWPEFLSSCNVVRKFSNMNFSIYTHQSGEHRELEIRSE